jgi:V8-like Glu-specific endopeptidase
VIRFADSQPTDLAFGLTNGHCYEGGMPDPGVVIVDKPSTRTFTLLNKAGTGSMGQVQATRLLYSTMTKTDVSLYQLGKTYQQLADQFPGFAPLTLAQNAPANGTGISVVSGYWKKIYTCSVDKTVYQLKEAGWTMAQSIKYHQPGCETIGGTSGSPIVNTTTHEVVGANNTGNEDGERCTLNNPCEVDENGNVTVEKGAAYGQQTWWFYTCLTTDHKLDLNKSGCLLPKP